MSPHPQALLVNYAALLGGAERILLDHAAALDGPVALACPEGPLAAAAREAGIAVHPLARRRLELRASARDRIATPLRMGAQAREVRRLTAALRPRCVVAWGMRALLSCSAGLRGLRPRPPLVFQHNDLLPSPFVGRAVRAAARRADAVVALSDAIAADLDPTARLDGRLTTIRAGVDLDRFSPAPGPPPAGPPTALVLGAIVGWKRPDLALEIAAAARTELPDLRLRLAGAPLGAAGEALLADLRRRAAAPDLAGRVEIAGPVADVPAALVAATCLLHCADAEPYGMAIVEALACGRPVVAPRGGGPRELVAPDRGVLYPPGDAAAGAAALARAVAAAPALGAGARAFAESELDVTVAGERFRALVAAVARQ